MTRVLENSGILFDDELDKLRAAAILACQDGLPEDLVYYLKALEAAYLGKVHAEHRRSAQEIGWKHLERLK